MVQYQYILPTVKQIKDLAQLHRNAEATLSARMDAQVSATTDSDADYAAEVVDGRVDVLGATHGSLGGNIRAWQLRQNLAITSEEVHRISDNTSLQQQIDALSEAVLEVLAIISEKRERQTGGIS